MWRFYVFKERIVLFIKKTLSAEMENKSLTFDEKILWSKTEVV